MTPSREAFTFRKAAGSRVAIDAYVSQLRPSAAIQHQICCTSYWKAELRKLASLSGFVACNRPFRTVPTLR
jgi:hypothetical protein